MTTPCFADRRGITLMEVLISIGILAIGLSSVVALVPAGKSEAAKAVMLDRGASLAMNVLNDAVTFGLTRPISITSPVGASAVFFDPLCTGTAPCVWLSGTAAPVGSGTLKPAGVFAISTSSSAVVDPSSVILTMLDSLTQGRDDLVYTVDSNEDDPPSNAFVGGERAYQGRTSALISLIPIGGSFGAGSLAKLSAVVFHNRNRTDQIDAIVLGTYNHLAQPAGTILVGALPDDRTLKEAVRPGSVIYCAAPSPAWYQVSMASIDDATAGLMYVTFVGDVEPPAGATVQIALDSIGLAERIVVLEGAGPYGR